MYSITWIFIIWAITAASLAQWDQRPLFEQEWNPFAQEPFFPGVDASQSYAPQESLPAGEGGLRPILQPKKELIPDRGGSTAGSTNEAKSGKLEGGGLFATANSNSMAQVTSLDKNKFQLALGKGSAGANAFEG